MNVKINLSEMLLSDDQKSVDILNISNSSKENKDLMSNTLLKSSKPTHGYNSNREYIDSRGRVQWKSFNTIEILNQPEWADTERVELNKPYLSPLINTFESHKSSHKFDNRDKYCKKKMKVIPKRIGANKVQVNLWDIDTSESSTVKSVSSKQFKKTNIFSLLNKEV